MLAEALTHDIIGRFTLLGNNTITICINFVGEAVAIWADFPKKIKMVDKWFVFIIPSSVTFYLI